MRQWVKISLVAAIATAISACGGGNSGISNTSIPTTQAGTTCTVDGVKQWAYDNLKDYYLFADQVANANPSNYMSADELVEDLRVQPYDRFSYVTDVSVSEEIFTAGKFYGIGYQWQPGAQDQVVVSAVYKDSPLGRAGTIKRGDVMVAINGTDLQDLTEEQYMNAIGTRERPATANWTFADSQSGQRKTVSLTPALYDINTVIHSEVMAHPSHSGKIGYLVFDMFIGTSEAELDAALSTFQNEGINELVLDLRYNGGGMVSIATKLASQIAGKATAGKQLMEYRFNRKYASEYNFPIEFSEEDIDLNLDRIIVLTTEGTASSSEIVINALSPYIEVITIGSRTNGKPYITYGNQYCEKEMHALQAEGFNANNVSVYGGIQATCGATDDLTRDFGSAAFGGPMEGMLQSAIDYIVYGTCATPFATTSPSLLNDGAQSLPIFNNLTENDIELGARYSR